MFFVFYRCAAVWPDNMMYEIYLSVALWRFTSTKFSSHFSQLFSLELFDSLDALRRPNSGSWLNSLYLSSLHELLNSYNLPKLMFNKHDRQKKLPRRITPLHVPNISYTLVPATCKCHCECEISTHITVYIYILLYNNKYGKKNIILYLFVPSSRDFPFTAPNIWLPFFPLPWHCRPVTFQMGFPHFFAIPQQSFLTFTSLLPQCCDSLISLSLWPFPRQVLSKFHCYLNWW